MSSVTRSIRSALETRLSQTTDVPSISFQNVKYKPSTGTEFIEVQFQPTSRRPSTMGPNPVQRYQGLLTLLIHWPENVGPGEAEGLADNLVERFESITDLYWSISTDSLLTEDEAFIVLENGGRVLVDNDDIYIRIEYTQVETPYSNPPWYVVPVRVAWYTYK